MNSKWMRLMGRAGCLLSGSALVLWLAGCASPGGMGMPATGRALIGGAMPSSAYLPENAPLDGSADKSKALGTTRTKPAEERPGLATGWGKRIRDEWHKESFVRASSKPAGTDMILYNDKAGVKAMSGYSYRVGPLQTAAGDLVEWGIKGGFGYLPASKSDGRRFVTGSAGSAYSIYIKNRCKSRLEVVLSVDGLDVIDGKPASFSKRGYVVAPGESLEVKGWRTGWDGVARFEFSDVGGSYANQRHGNVRNVGVIGLAVFGEKGVDPWTWMPNEVRTRASADPFAKAP